MSSIVGSPEQAVEASALAWTFLQPVEFMDNALEWPDSSRAEGVVREPFVDRLSAMVHPVDIGDVAATALSEDDRGGHFAAMAAPDLLAEDLRESFHRFRGRGTVCHLTSTRRRCDEAPSRQHERSDHYAWIGSSSR